MKISEISFLSDVKVCIDEVGVNDSDFLVDADNTQMRDIIRSKIADGLRYVNMSADESFLEPLTERFEAQTDVNGMCEVALKPNFLRLCYVKLDDWQVPAVDPILYSDREYASLKNRYTTGYPDNPKVAIVGGVERKLELYSSRVKNGTARGEMAYVDDGVSGSSYHVSSKLYRGLVYYVAGLTLLTYKDAHADSLMNQAMIMIGAK